ncbi:MAG: PAS domain S-box protein [Candidatus Sulfotelmatobacter sp.]
MNNIAAVEALASRTSPSGSNKLRALLVEDNPLDAALVLRALYKEGFDVTADVVQDEAAFTRALHTHPPEVVLADYNLPNWKGMEALDVLRREGLDIPMILVTGSLGDMTAVECIKKGAADYVLKDGLARLPSAVQRALQEKALRERQKRSDDALREHQYALDQHAIVATTDVHGIITYTNDKFCAISKYSRDELLGQNHRIVNSGYHSREFFQQMYHTIGNGQVWRGEIRNRAKDGSIYWVAATIVPFLDPEGKPRQYMAIRTDITERKQAEQDLAKKVEELARAQRALQAQTEMLQSVLNSMGEGVVVSNSQGEFVLCNPAAERIAGQAAVDTPLKERPGRFNFYLPDGVTPFPANRLPLAHALRGKASEVAVVIRNPKLGNRWVQASGQPVRDENGVVWGGLVIFRDVTLAKAAERERHKAEQDLAKKADELARSNADLEQFAYVASHDLQEPLRMVTAYTQLLAERYRGKLDESADKFIGYASEGALRMQVLIQDLLAFSRVGRNGFTSESVDCNAVMKDVLQTLTPAIQESGAVVTHAELPAVWADRTQMVQLFQNLIQNAIKFRGKDPPLVSVQAEQADQRWRFSVSDNGIGIAPEDAEKIFAAFQRLHTRTEYPGNGIGLAICKKIIEHNGGKIWVESQAGHGSTFKFTLPCRGPDGNPDQRPDQGEEVRP